MLNQLTILIPLYQSNRFAEIIEKNIDDHLAYGAKIIVSDRHQLDDYADRLSLRYRDHDQVKIVQYFDDANWVININSMIEQIKTPFFRVLPHDDSSTAIASQALLNALSENKNCIVSTGIIRAIDLHNQRLPTLDKLHEKPCYFDRKWDFAKAMDFFYQGYYPGAFKGVIRKAWIDKYQLYIEPTKSLIDSERCWLFGLYLIADFCFVDIDMLYKRHYAESTHKQWKRTDKTPIEQAEVLVYYCNKVITQPQQKQCACRHIYQNSFIRYQRLTQNISGAVPYYKDYIL